MTRPKMTLEQAAEIAGVHRSTLDRWRRKGHIPFKFFTLTPCSKKLWAYTSDVEQWIDDRHEIFNEVPQLRMVAR